MAWWQKLAADPAMAPLTKLTPRECYYWRSLVDHVPGLLVQGPNKADKGTSLHNVAVQPFHRPLTPWAAIKSDRHLVCIWPGHLRPASWSWSSLWGSTRSLPNLAVALHTRDPHRGATVSCLSVGLYCQLNAFDGVKVNDCRVGDC